MAITEKQQRFIEDIAKHVQKYARAYGILVHSPIIAQAILESGWGESKLASKYHNYFGMKCGTTWTGKSVNMETKEEYTPGTLTTIKDNFRVYDSMEEGVKGYFEFIQKPRYKNLKGITDAKKYLQLIKADGYATASSYVESTYRLITQYELTEYDAEGGTNMKINIIKQTGTHGLYSTGRGKDKYLVYHYTAGVTSKKGSARATASWFANPKAGGTADFIVDDEEIVQYNPDPEKYSCWAVGGSAYGNRGGKLHGVATNHNCISIEICSTNKTGRVTNPNDDNWYFTDAALANAAKLGRYLMEVYGIPASRVIRHYDVTGKLCPGIKGWNLENGSDDKKWQTFKAQLSAEAEDNTPAPAPTPAPSGATTVNYAYKVTVSDLNIRKGPGTNYDSAGYTGKGVFTIVAEKGGWGKLKSGAGWISLNSKYGHKVSSGSTTPAAASSTLKWTVTISDLRIRKGPGTNYGWTGAYTGKGTFTIVEQKNGWGRLKSGAGWISLNSKYGHKVSSGSTTPAAASSTLKWTVTISDLRIRKGPGTNYGWTGAYTGKGTFTIVEQKNGWGRLKSGAGWISLNTAYGHKA